mgnify:CR=1 FL=1
MDFTSLQNTPYVPPKVTLIMEVLLQNGGSSVRTRLTTQHHQGAGNKDIGGKIEKGQWDNSLF